MNKDIEVELRTFINKESYEKLLDKLKNERIDEEKQITTYYNCKQDFRMMETKKYCKLWLKEGKIHDDARKEYEVMIDKKYLNSLKGMLKQLEYEPEIKWYRNRKTLDYKKVKLTIDYSVGYGYIIEGEILVDNAEKIDNAKQIIKNVFEELDINEISEKKVFDEKYNDYKINWKDYIKEVDEEDFLK